MTYRHGANASNGVPV